jgi:hypothetical protein
MTFRPARMRSNTARLLVLFAVSALAIAVVAVPAAADRGKSSNRGFLTSQAAMLDPAVPGATVKPLITVGETLPGTNYMFESIPDGISLLRGRHGKVQAYVNHETSTVPFPAGFNDFTNALLSKLTLSKSGGVLAGSYVIPDSANYQRFCSNFLASRKHGFEFPLLFTNEEATDFVNRTGTAFPGTPGVQEQAGVVVAFNPRTEQYKTIYGMGRHNHENSVALEGYRRPVVLSGDDTFTAPSSQLYMYTARNAQAVWNDEGSLWAFKSDVATINDYGDLTATNSVSGTFIPVPRNIAVGEQTGLENWSNENNVFQFIRLEDIAYDRNRPNVVYMADTGEPRAKPHATSGRLFRDTTGGGPYPNGRIFKFVFDKRDPTKVKSLSILIDGDALGAASAGVLDLIHQPDNLETTEKLLLIQEDPGSQNQYPLGTGTTARIWAYDLKKGGAPFVVARVNQSADNGPTDVNSTLGLAGAWESSGIVDASRFFGKGAFLVDIQAGTLIVEQEPRGNLLYQREGGQLLLFRLPTRGDHDDDDDDDRGDDDDD